MIDALKSLLVSRMEDAVKYTECGVCFDSHEHDRGALDFSTKTPEFVGSLPFSEGLDTLRGAHESILLLGVHVVSK